MHFACIYFLIITRFMTQKALITDTYPSIWHKHNWQLLNNKNFQDHKTTTSVSIKFKTLFINNHARLYTYEVQHTDFTFISFRRTFKIEGMLSLMNHIFKHVYLLNFPEGVSILFISLIDAAFANQWKHCAAITVWNDHRHTSTQHYLKLKLKIEFSLVLMNHRLYLDICWIWILNQWLQIMRKSNQYLWTRHKGTQESQIARLISTMM